MDDYVDGLPFIRGVVDMARIVLLSSLFIALMVLASAASLVPYGTDEDLVGLQEPPALPDPWNVSSHDDLLDSSSSADVHYLNFNLTDTSENWDRTPTVQDHVTNNYLPVFTEDLSDAEATTGDQFNFSVNVTDDTAIASASVFVNFAHGGERVDSSRWPKLAAYVERIHSRPSFKACIEEEKAMFGGGQS